MAAVAPSMLQAVAVISSGERDSFPSPSKESSPAIRLLNSGLALKLVYNWRALWRSTETLWLGSKFPFSESAFTPQDKHTFLMPLLIYCSSYIPGYSLASHTRTQLLLFRLPWRKQVLIRVVHHSELLRPMCRTVCNREILIKLTMNCIRKVDYPSQHGQAKRNWELGSMSRGQGCLQTFKQEVSRPPVCACQITT